MKRSSLPMAAPISSTAVSTLFLVLFTLLATSILAAGTAGAQIGRDVGERASNRKQISQGTQMAQRDASEMEAFSSQLASIERAIAAADGAAANQALDGLAPMMKTEVEQAGAKAEAAKKELAASASETGSNRRESRRSRDDLDRYDHSQDAKEDMARDALNRADDARDLADDKKDLEATVQRATREQEIAQSMAGYRFDLASERGREEASKRVALLKEFGGLMQTDLGATQQEIAEDKKEAGEDRRETRDDVREADEPDNRYRRETGDFGRNRR